MKKEVLIISILFLLAWVFGYFILDATAVVHTPVALAALFYIQTVVAAEVNTDREIKIIISV